MNYECDGQLSIFDILKENPTEESQEILKDGKIIYILNKGDIRTITNEDDYMSSYFHTEELLYDEITAKKQAEINLKKYNAIPKEDIHPQTIKAYNYIRTCDNREMIAFYCLLNDGWIYAKDFYTYHYMMKFKNETTAKKKVEIHFSELLKNNKENIMEKNNYIPIFKNMYPIKNIENGSWPWEYTEAACSKT